MSCTKYLQVPPPSCPYSILIPDSTHLRKCELHVGICNERNWQYEYGLCQTFLDGELEWKKKKTGLIE